MHVNRFVVRLACAATFATGYATSAGIALGTAVRALPQAGSGSAVERSDPAAGPGSYSSDLDGTPFAGRAFAQLDWQRDALSFTGLADGGPDATLRSQGIAMLELSGATTFAISWTMSAAVGSGVDISWGLVNAAGGGEPDLGVTFAGTTGTSFGGVTAVANGSFAGVVEAGTYLLVMLAEATASAGQFGMSARWSPVPAPGTIAVLALCGTCVPTRRRR